MTARKLDRVLLRVRCWPDSSWGEAAITTPFMECAHTVRPDVGRRAADKSNHRQRLPLLRLGGERPRRITAKPRDEFPAFH